MQKLITLLLSIITMSVAVSQNITGSGTAGYVPRFTGTTQVGNSVLFQNAPLVGINTTAPTGVLDIYSACATGNIGTLVVNTNTQTNVAGSCLLSGGSIGDAIVVRNTVGSNISPVTRTDFIVRSGTGRVGIGKPSPAAQLDVQPTESAVDPLLISNFSANAVFNVKSSGNVGIGITAPSALLHIKNSSSSVSPLLITCCQ
jgi:hypothetical protein